MWEVYEHRNAVGQLDALPVDILKRYEKWKDVVRVSGPKGLREIRGFRDEALAGKWKGYRASRLSQQYRVVYRIERESILIQVVRVTAHDYRSR
jgi:addiction module RelE/StbE family toxin